MVAALASRNAPIADFWLRGASERQQLQADLSGREVLIVDAEDTFTSMIAKQLKSLGLTVTVRGFQEPYSFDGYDLVIMGPGPATPPRSASRRSATCTWPSVRCSASAGRSSPCA